MADEPLTAAAAVPPDGAHNVRAFRADEVSGRMVLLTWAAFLIAVILLHRLAWKPILRALDKRERDIRDALDGAERARREAAQADERNRRAMAEAAERARALAEESRRAAERTAARLEAEARDKARRVAEDAAREIADSRRRAADDLRRETAGLAIALSERLLAERLTPEQRRAYEAHAIESLPT
jgi:F-type H+-transporting ATPase subunit b